MSERRNNNEGNEYMAFKKEHPEIDIGLMIDAYQKCQGKSGTIKEIYEHVSKCRWCSKFIENAKKVEESGILISKVRDWQVGRY